MLERVLNLRRRVRGPAMALCLSLMGTAASGQTIINLPSDTLPPAAASGVQLNVGVQGSIPAFYRALAGSEVNITGGSVSSQFNAAQGSVVNISAGEIGQNFTLGGVLNFSGGTLGSGFRALSGSAINITGRSFTLNGSPVESLVFNEPFTINNSINSLEGELADGARFRFSDPDFFEPGATVTLTVIPEPASLLCVALSSALFLSRRRKRA